MHRKSCFVARSAPKRTEYPTSSAISGGLTSGAAAPKDPYSVRDHGESSFLLRLVLVLGLAPAPQPHNRTGSTTGAVATAQLANATAITWSSCLAA